MLHDGDLGGGHAEAHQLALDPAVGREATRVLGCQRAEVREDHLRRSRQRKGAAVALAVACRARLLPDAVGVGDQLVELVLPFIASGLVHQPHVDGGVPPVGDDGKQDVVAFLHAPPARLDGLDPPRKLPLVGPEGVAGLRGDELAAVALDPGQLQVVPQVVLAHHVRHGAEHVDQLGNVDELGEALHRLVGARRLQLQLGAGVAKGAGPGIELVDAPAAQQPFVLVTDQGEHLAHGVGDGRARGLDQGPARVPRFHEATLDVEVPGPLRAVGIDALQVHPVGGEGQLPELLRLVHDQLVDAELLDGQHVVAPAADILQLLGKFLLHGLQALAGDAVVASGIGYQVLEAPDLILDHAPLEGGGDGDEAERGMGDDDRVPPGGGGPGQEAGALVTREVLFVRDQDAGGRVELQELARGLGQAVARHDQHGLGDQPQPLLLHDGGGNGERLARPHGVRDVGGAGGNDAPDHPLLVFIQLHDVACTGKRQVPSVEVARHEVVEAVVVKP